MSKAANSQSVRKKPAASSGSPKPSKRKPAKRKAAEPPKPWLEHYPENVAWDAELKPQSLPAMFRESAKAHATSVCTVFLGKETSYGEMARWVDRLTAGLQSQGIGRGHRVGLFLPNTPYYVAAYYAILQTGAVAVNFNPLYTVEELVDQARDAGVVAMITLDLGILFDKVDALLNKGVIQKGIVCPFAPLLPTIKQVLFKLLKRGELADTTSPRERGEILHWNDLMAADTEVKPVIIRPEDDVALLQYTGGTTGTPKGAMLTHANLTVNVEQVRLWATKANLGKERIIAILPFFHVFAMTTILNFGIRSGSTLILMPRFDLDQAVALIKQAKPTILPGVPTLYTALLNHKDISTDALSSLKMCISGGAALPLEVRREFERKSGCSLVEGYGLSETSPVATVNPIKGIEKENSIGQPVPQTRISIRDPEKPDKEMPLGEPGEICISGPQVMKGYWNNKAETEEAFAGEFFRTGDIGYMDEFGFTYLIDRIKDIINCSGFKVYPRKIEEAIYAHPAVAETIVVGMPDEYRGEAPKAFIKLKQGKVLSEAEIFEHLKPKISKIEMPEEIEFRNDLPKTMVGKLSKKDLREEGSKP